MLNIIDLVDSDNIDDYKEFLDILLKIKLNASFSKNELFVFLYCLNKERRSFEISEYLGWKSQNIARLLISMSQKGMLFKSRDVESYRQQGYIYKSNLEYL